MRTGKMPRGARHLRTYAELRKYLSDFVAGIYMFLWIVGRPGVAKTESIREAVRGRDAYYRKGGQLTPLQLYIDCYRHRGHPIILDDAEHLLDDKVGARLIAALGETSPVKELSYGSTSRLLGDVPQSFPTTSPLCVIANHSTKHADIQSRATTLYHDPTSLEIHREAARWFYDQEIHDFIGQHVGRLRSLDVRWYVQAEQDKRAGRDWRQILLRSYAYDQAVCVVQDLEEDPAYPTREDKARHFVELMAGAKGASRASYFRMRRHLESEGRLIPQTVAPIPLRHQRRPGTPSLLELESMTAIRDAQAVQEPLDTAAREGFAQPIAGGVPPRPTPQRLILDDTLPGEGPAEPDEEAEE